MRRALSAVMGAALLLTASGGVTAVTTGSTFSGVWTSRDIADGSTQYLLVGSDAGLHVTLVDLYATYCASHGAASTVFTGSGTGTIDGDALDVAIDRADCGSTPVDLGVLSGLSYAYQGAAGTLTDSYGSTWHRVPSAAQGARTVSIAPFAVRWSATNPDAITDLTWNGSPNLTNSAPHRDYCPEGGLSEFFGNSWGTGEGSSYVSPVGWGTSGIWARYGMSGVDVLSAATGCYGTSGIPVRTRYGFVGGGPSVARIQVERRFDFGSAPFTADFRPYIPRLSLANDYSRVLYPGIAGSLVNRDAFECPYGCPVLDWKGTWFAVHDPRTGRGMVVRHEASSALADLWIDLDAFSTSTSTSVVLRAPAAGFTGTLVDRQVLCFYDKTIWQPSMTPPAACTKPWANQALAAGSKLGLASSAGTYTASTKVSPLGGYVTWRANLGLAGAGQTVGINVATRRPDGSWTPFSQLTSRRADDSGVVTFSWRQASPKWVSLQFVGVGVATSASQARWK
jgi:hypothetical protein